MREFEQWQLRALDVGAKAPGLNAGQLRVRLAASGFHELTRQDINQFLYGQARLFARQPGPALQPRWVRRHEPGRAFALKPTLIATPSRPALDLYPWQRRALVAWNAAGHRGVVEAVTGSGKSRVAGEAAIAELRAGGRVAVLVHTRELLRQWHRELKDWLRRCGMNEDVGLRGCGSTDDLASHRIVVATAHAAAKIRLLPVHGHGLVIVDECHHFGAESWKVGLRPEFARRLGLTATYERDDDGIERVLDPYFGGKCYELGYEEALRDRIVADFKVAFIGVDLTADEAAGYEAASAKMRRYRAKLIDGHGLPRDDPGKFLAHAARLAGSGKDGARLAGFYLSAMSQRRGLLATASGKLAGLRALAPAIRRAIRTILFGQTCQAATDAIDLLAKSGIRGAVLDATMDVDERAQVFAGFEDGRHELIAAPRLLDEGVDVPSADLAIVLAASRTRRQMVQRLGRVLRRKADGRLARIAIFYARGTFEDPASGGHEAFLDVVAGVACDIRHFDASEPDRAIVAYLNDWAPRR